MAASDVSCAVIQVETAIGNLTKKLDRLPEKYREEIALELRVLDERVSNLTNVYLGEGACEDVCVGAKVPSPPAAVDQPEQKFLSVRAATAEQKSHVFRRSPAAVNRIPGIGANRLPIHLFMNRDDHRHSSEIPMGEDHLLREKRFRMICKAVTGIVYDWDIQTNRIYRSKGFEKILGIPVEQAGSVHAWWMEYMHPEDWVKVRPVMEEIYQGKRDTYNLEYRVMAKDGHWVVLWDQGSIAKDEQGKPVFAAGICLDISRRKQLEKTLLITNKAMARSNIALRASDEQFRVALANEPIAVFRTDADLRYTWFYNAQMGEKAKLLIDKRDDEVVSFENVSELIELKKYALESGKPVRKEISFIMDNEPKYMIVSVEPLFDQNQKAEGLIGTYLDITEQRRLKIQEREKNFQLEVEKRLMEHRELERQELAYRLHEGPIQTLSGLGFSLHVAREMAGEGDASIIIKQISDELKRLIVELRRVTYELRPAGLARFGLQKAIQIYVEDFREHYPEISIHLSLEKQANRLPENDNLVLFRILQESLTNVARHAHATAVHVSISVENRKVRMEIQDNGQGFDVHYNWLKLTRQGRFGLVGMKERAEALGGKLKVKSIRNEGTTIQVIIPVEKEIPINKKE